MKCPICVEEDLVMADRQGIEIDYCPKCRGVWLDRGELDKIIERSAARRRRSRAAAGIIESPRGIRTVATTTRSEKEADCWANSSTSDRRGGT